MSSVRSLASEGDGDGDGEGEGEGDGDGEAIGAGEGAGDGFVCGACVLVTMSGAVRALCVKDRAETSCWCWRSITRSLSKAGGLLFGNFFWRSRATCESDGDVVTLTKETFLCPIGRGELSGNAFVCGWVKSWSMVEVCRPGVTCWTTTLPCWPCVGWGAFVCGVAFN